MQRIKSFTEFISEELRDIITDISKSGRTKTAERIWTEPTKAKSPSSATLLKSDLRAEEFSDIVKNISNNNIKKMLLKHKNNPKVERLAVTLNNIEYLKDKLKERGELRCEYCNKGPLVVYDIGKGSINPGYLYSKQTEVYDKKDLERTKKANYIVNGSFKMRDGATVDHKQPQSKGGDKFSYNNLAVCCYWCNQKKGNMSYEDWMDKIKKPVLESVKIEKEEVDNILIDLKDNLNGGVEFFGYKRDNSITGKHHPFIIRMDGQKYLDGDFCRMVLRSDIPSRFSPNIHTRWSVVKETIEEAIDRLEDIGICFKQMDIMQEMKGSREWKTITYKKIPNEIPTDKFNWISIDFYIKQKSTIDFVKDIFRKN